MVMRYAHPQEKHRAEAVKRLEAMNAAKEIAACETAATISATVKPLLEETEMAQSKDKSSRVN
jgi:hypothetical protein